MLELSLITFFIRAIPEGIILTWVSYILASKPINKKRILISGFFIGLITYIIRLMPINFGVHIILILILYILILHKLNNINLYQAVRSGLTTYILLSMSESITMFIYIFVFKLDVETLSQQSLQGILLGIPSLLFVITTGILIRYFKKKKLSRVNENV